MIWIGIFLACGCGTLLRYVLSKGNRLGNLPLGTLIANLFACFLLGYFSNRLGDENLYLMLGTGLCGGLSTFSTLQVESLQLQKKPVHLMGFWLLTYGLGWVLLILGKTITN